MPIDKSRQADVPRGTIPALHYVTIWPEMTLTRGAPRAILEVREAPIFDNSRQKHSVTNALLYLTKKYDKIPRVGLGLDLIFRLNKNHTKISHKITDWRDFTIDKVGPLCHNIMGKSAHRADF